MRVAFVHDFYLEKSRTKDIYYSNNFNYHLWKKYLSVFDELYVISREKVLQNETNKDNNERIASGPGVTFFPVPSIMSPKKFFFERKKIKERIKKIFNKCDGVIARLPSVNGIIAIEIADELELPWTVEVVGYAWDSYWNYGNLQGKVFAPYANHKISGIISQSKSALYVTGDFLQSKYPSYGTVDHCSNVSIDPVETSVLDNKIISIKNKSKDKDCYSIGLIGGMSANYKGIDIAIKALSLLVREKYNVSLRILGSGSYQKNYIKLAKKLNVESNIFFDGTLPSGPLVLEWLDKLDLYIQPSRTEGLPRAVIEALSRGLPVIGSKVGGIPELINSECTFEKNNYNELAVKIKNILDNQKLQVSLANQNFNKAKQYYSNVLESRRNRFYSKFKEQIKSERK